MKFNFLVICISIFALLSCNISSEKKIDELSIIIISSDISIGENVINFAVLDINGNQINNDLNEIKLKNLESENETIISATYQNWFKGKGAYRSKIDINETGFHELIVTFNKYESRAIFNVNTKSVTPTIDKNGKITSPPLEDLSPMIPRDELEQNMLVGIHEKSTRFSPSISDKAKVDGFIDADIKKTVKIFEGV